MVPSETIFKCESFCFKLHLFFENFRIEFDTHCHQMRDIIHLAISHFRSEPYGFQISSKHTHEQHQKKSTTHSQIRNTKAELYRIETAYVSLWCALYKFCCLYNNYHFVAFCLNADNVFFFAILWSRFWIFAYVKFIRTSSFCVCTLEACLWCPVLKL